MKRISVANKPRGHIFGATIFDIPAKFIRARCVKVVVADITDKEYWAREFVGQERRAIELRIDIPGEQYEIFYLDDEDGQTVAKLTTGKGDPTLGFKQLNVSAFADDPTIKVSYGKLTKA